MKAPTLKERREQLTIKVNQAREEYLKTKRLVNKQVKEENPTLEWWEIDQKVEEDPRTSKAEARLLALCEAANIMGAEVE